MATLIKLISLTFDTKGNDLDTLKLHSITFISLFLAIYCILKGPLISNFSGLHSCVFTNFILNKLNNKQFRNIIFTNYLSKSSTFTSKRKIENYYYELLNIDTSIPFITVCDIIISYIFNKETYPKIISFLKSNKFKYDDFDKLYKHSSIKENFKKNYSTKFKKALKESLN